MQAVGTTPATPPTPATPAITSPHVAPVISAPAVAVVVACYNYGRFLPDLVASLYGGPTSLGDHPGQTFKDFELIIVDDGSEDYSVDMMHKLAEQHGGIRLHFGYGHGGTPRANNRGIAMSRAPLIAMLDADDMMEPWRLELMVAAARKNPHSIICDDLQIFSHGHRKDTITMFDYDFPRLLRMNIMHAGLLFPIEAWRDAGGYPESFTTGRQDWSFNVALGAAGWCGVNIHEAGYLYRREQHNRSVFTENKHNQFVRQMKTHFADLYKGRWPVACCGNRGRARRTGGLVGQMVSVRRNGRMELVGASGMVKVRYLLKRSGTQPYTGAGTKTTYTFSTLEPEKWVDGRDVESLLAKFEHRQRVFELAEMYVAEEEAVTVDDPSEKELIDA